MYRQIGRKVYTLGKNHWNREKWGIIVGIGDKDHFIVKYQCNRKAWIKREHIMSWK